MISAITMLTSQKNFDYSGKFYERLYAEILDDQDPLKDLRNEFIIPSKDDLKRKTLAKSGISHFLKFVIGYE